MRVRAQAGSGVTSLKPIERVWVYMPYMHSETLEDQQARQHADASHSLLACHPPT